METYIVFVTAAVYLSVVLILTGVDAYTRKRRADRMFAKKYRYIDDLVTAERRRDRG